VYSYKDVEKNIMLTLKMLKDAEKEGIESQSDEEQRKHDDMIEYALDAFETTIEEILDHARDGTKMANGEYTFRKSVLSFIDTDPLYATGQYYRDEHRYGGLYENVLLEYAKEIYKYIQDKKLVSKEINFSLDEQTLEFVFCWK